MGTMLLLSMMTTLPLTFREDTAKSAACAEVAKQMMQKYAKLNVKPDEIGLCVMEFGGDGTVRYGHFRGNEGFYPASVVKLFYLAHGAFLQDQGALKLTPERNRAFTEMIRESDNDATAFVLDELTGTTSGPELEPKKLQDWERQRQKVNNFFVSRGYKGVNACQKTWTFGPYGRDKQSYGPNNENRNRLTPFETTRLMAEITLVEGFKPASQKWMMDILERKDPKDSQRAGFIGGVMPKNARIWSKSGWTSWCRHDVALIQRETGERAIFCVYLLNHPNDKELFFDLSRGLLSLVDGFGSPPDSRS